MDPSLGALADQSATVGLTVQTNANSGYTLAVSDSATGLQSSGSGNPVIAKVSTGKATSRGLAGGANWGYTVTGTGATIDSAFSGSKYAGYTSGGETIATRAGSTGGVGRHDQHRQPCRASTTRLPRASTPTPSPTRSPRTTTDLETSPSARDPRRARQSRALSLATLVATTLLVATSVGSAEAARPEARRRPALARSVGPPDPVADRRREPSSKTLARISQPEQRARQGDDREPNAVARRQRQGQRSDRARPALGQPRRLPGGRLDDPGAELSRHPADRSGSGASPPDLYFIGFLVTPLPSRRRARSQVINQIGSFITIDVPGPRMRKLHGDVRRPEPRPRLARQRHAAHRERRPHGRSLLGRERHDVVAGRLVRAAAPRARRSCRADRSRFFSVTAKPAWPVGMVRMTVHVIYPGRTEATTKELTFSKQVLVVSPVVPEGVATLLVASCCSGSHGAAAAGGVRCSRRHSPAPERSSTEPAAQELVRQRVADELRPASRAGACA